MRSLNQGWGSVGNTRRNMCALGTGCAAETVTLVALQLLPGHTLVGYIHSHSFPQRRRQMCHHAEPRLLLVSLGVLSVSWGSGAVLSAHSLFHGWAFSSSGSSIGTVALMTLALKSFCPGFGAFCVDTRYRLTATVKHQKAPVIVGAE